MSWPKKASFAPPLAFASEKTIATSNGTKNSVATI